MNTSLSLKAFGHASSLLLSIFFVLCVVFDLLFPNYSMYKGWQMFLPGFEWLSWSSFLLGIIETYLYGWLVSLVWVSIYNFFILRVNNSHPVSH